MKSLTVFGLLFHNVPQVVPFSNEDYGQVCGPKRNFFGQKY